MRVCGNCGDEKPIAGVWYLLAGQASGFACESCYANGARPARRA